MSLVESISIGLTIGIVCDNLSVLDKDECFDYRLFIPYIIEVYGFPCFDEFIDPVLSR